MLRNNKLKPYYPAEVVHLCRRQLALDFVALPPSPADRDKFPSRHTYRRRDGVMVNYLGTIRDMDDDANGMFPTLAEWLSNAPVIENNSITIAPFVQVDLGRRHFNTLVIHADAHGNTQVYILEPRSNQFVLPKRFTLIYPIERAVELLKTRFGENVACLNLGVQSLLDDISCGAHHINFAEMISHLDGETIRDREKLQRALRVTSADSRLLDGGKFDDEAPAVVMPSGISSTSLDLEDGFTDIALTRDSDSERSQDAMMRVMTTSEPIVSGSVPSLLNGMDKANSILQRYHAECKPSGGLFSKHTRHATVRAIQQRIAEIAQSDDTPDMKKFNVAMLLFSAFLTNKSRHSQLRGLIASALASVLDCERDYAVVASITRHKDESLVPGVDLFRHQLTMLQLRAGVNVNNAKVEHLFATMSELHDLDTSFWSRLCCTSSSEARRAQLHTIMSENSHCSVTMRSA